MRAETDSWWLNPNATVMFTRLLDRLVAAQLGTVNGVSERGQSVTTIPCHQLREDIHTWDRLCVDIARTKAVWDRQDLPHAVRLVAWPRWVPAQDEPQLVSLLEVSGRTEQDATISVRPVLVGVDKDRLVAWVYGIEHQPRILSELLVFHKKQLRLPPAKVWSGE